MCPSKTSFLALPFHVSCVNKLLVLFPILCLLWGDVVLWAQVWVAPSFPGFAPFQQINCRVKTGEFSLYINCNVIKLTFKRPLYNLQTYPCELFLIYNPIALYLVTPQYFSLSNKKSWKCLSINTGETQSTYSMPSMGRQIWTTEEKKPKLNWKALPKVEQKFKIEVGTKNSTHDTNLLFFCVVTDNAVSVGWQIVLKNKPVSLEALHHLVLSVPVT